MELVNQKSQLTLLEREEFFISELVSDNGAGISCYVETVDIFQNFPCLTWMGLW